jgi:hypothetical protein
VLYAYHHNAPFMASHYEGVDALPELFNGAKPDPQTSWVHALALAEYEAAGLVQDSDGEVDDTATDDPRDDDQNASTQAPLHVQTSQGGLSALAGLAPTSPGGRHSSAPGPPTGSQGDNGKVDMPENGPEETSVDRWGRPNPMPPAIKDSLNWLAYAAGITKGL